MTHDLEQELRRALRPVEPSREFTAGLLTGLAAARDSATAVRRHGWRSMAMAASVVLASGLGILLYQHQQRERAHAQLLEALTITSRSLDRAYRAVRWHGSDAGEHGG
ncbi:MAG TPA: hypothetical protein VKC11_10775 [Steroidobacteraceae bacterium]|nr:hypothetical protein [Steroidobacteraceae bacterium]